MLKEKVICFVIFRTADGSTHTADGITYLFNYSGLNWYSASNFCKQRNMVLVDLRSLTDYVRVISLIQLEGRADNSFWIGLTDQAVDNTFVWDSDGTRLSFSFWQAAEPSDDGSCVEATANRGWNDVSCSKIRWSICQTW